MHKEVSVVVNNVSLNGIKGQYTVHRHNKAGVCHHFRECGINSLVARTPVSGAWSKEKKYSLSESINKTCLLVPFFLVPLLSLLSSASALCAPRF